MRTRVCSEIRRHAQAASVFPALLLWKLHKSQGTLHGHYGTPPTKGNHHRPKGVGHRPIMEISATNIWSVGSIDGRPAKASCRNLFWQQRTDKAWQSIFKACLHQHPPYHVRDSKEDGPRPSDHQSHISMRDGPRSQSMQFNIRMKCIQTNKGPNLNHG